jgi:hypothetical protein
MFETLHLDEECVFCCSNQTLGEERKKKIKERVRHSTQKKEIPLLE